MKGELQMSGNNKATTIDDPILPDGFEEGEDLFATVDPVKEAPAKETKDTETDPVADSQDPAPAIETEAEKKARIKVKFNHEERELDEDEARPFIEKGMNYDKKIEELEIAKHQLTQAEQLARRMGFADSSEMLKAAEENLFNKRVAELVDGGVHEAIAKDLVQREWEKNAVKEVPPDPVVQEMDEFVKANPGVDKLPEEVMQAVVFQKVPLQVAYERYKANKAQEELRILKQNQAAAAKAPVASTTKSGSTDQKATDPFLQGFDSDAW
ncbi:MAG: hypothetical protein M0P69_12310 [Bacteroidales bacterium]|nr:hypothetical protein [Bacteroidales bacterium]